MRIATLREGGRDGTLVVVSADGARFVRADAAPTMQAALDDWGSKEPALRALADKLDRGEIVGEELRVEALAAPLPRAYEWIDGSAYINHIVLVRKARGAEPPATLRTDPLVYQGGSGVLSAATDVIPVGNVAHGADLEAEIGVILDDTPIGTAAADAGSHIKLLVLINDVTLRNLIPDELAKGFGFFVSKPSTAFSPFAVTPDELGDAWRDGRVHLPLRSLLNGDWLGEPEAGPEMHFSFHDLVAHVTRTRSLTAGTILGSGTVSNEDEAMGVSCLAERRMREVLAGGQATTRFLVPGDVVEIEMLDRNGRNVFGTIRQRVVAA